jgi:hypothetical protein
MVLATMTNVGIVTSSRSVPLPRTNRRVLSLKLGQQQQYLLALEKRTSRDMSWRKLRQKLVSPVSLIYMERHTFTQNKVKRDKNEIVWHYIVL